MYIHKFVCVCDIQYMHTYARILFSHKKGRNLHHLQHNEKHRKTVTLISLSGVKFPEAESRAVVTRGQSQREMEKYWLKDTNFQFKGKRGRLWWHMTVIPHLGGGRE